MRYGRLYASQTEATKVYAGRMPALQAPQAAGGLLAFARQALRSSSPFRGIGAVALLLCGSLTACATGREPEIRTVEVKVPVAVSCVPANLGAAPTYPDTDKALRDAVDVADMLKLLAAGRLLRIQRQAETEPVIDSCR